MEQNYDNDNEYCQNENCDAQELKEIAEHECGSRHCNCGKSDCEYAADFFTAAGIPSLTFGTDEDFIDKNNLEAALDYSDYAMRVGVEGDGRILAEGESGEIVYENTADYRMITRDEGVSDASRS